MSMLGNNLVLGQIDGAAESLVMSPQERARHLAIFGATRTGKSKLLEDCARQDILAWHRTNCGMLYIDPHGSSFDSLMEWIASEDIRDVPIIPIELRRTDWAIAYNLLRRRTTGDPGVAISNFVRGILHGWGQSTSNETPRLGKWLRTILCTLYENSLTLAESAAIVANPEFRNAMAANVCDPYAKMVWDSARSLKEDKFQEMIESTVSRLAKFLSTQVMRACLCQTEASLDLSVALEQGAIILVSLSRKGAQFDEEDAATFGSLILADLWTAAQNRGKKEESELRPFYVYLDEFQEFLNPTMAKTLAQASGFGLHFTLANQFPSQLMQGEHGKEVFNEVMANARSKIVFQLEHPEDLDMLGLALFRQMIDPDQVKFQPYSTKVLEYQLQYVRGYSMGITNSEGQTSTRGRSISESAGESITRGESLTAGSGQSSADGTGYGHSHQAGLIQGHTNNSGETESENWTHSDGGASNESTGTSSGRSLQFPLGRPDEELSENIASLQNGKLESEELQRLKDERARGISLTESASQQRSSSAGRTSSDARGGSTARTNSRSNSQQRSSADSDSTSRSHSDTESKSLAIGESYAESQQWSLSESKSESEANSTSRALSRGETLSPMLIPILGKEAGTPIYRTIQEQVFRAAQYLAGQPDRHCVVKLVSVPTPIALVTRTITQALTTPEWVAQFVTTTLQNLDFAVPLSEAVQRIHDRGQGLYGMNAPTNVNEPITSKRRINPQPRP